MKDDAVMGRDIEIRARSAYERNSLEMMVLTPQSPQSPSFLT